MGKLNSCILILADLIFNNSDPQINCSLLQVLRDVEMEHLGRKSGDSFRSLSSYNQSRRSRSSKKHLERKSTKTHAAQKVRKHTIKKCENSSYVFWIIALFLYHVRLGVCMHLCIMIHEFTFCQIFCFMHVYLCLYVFSFKC